MHTLRHPGNHDSIAFSPDGKRIVSGLIELDTNTAHVKIWNVETGTEVNTFVRVR